jgi:hypothetical protein
MSRDVRLEEIRAKYPHAKFPPDPQCRRCRGDGEYVRGPRWKEIVTPCMCIYFDHDTRKMFEGVLKETVEKLNRRLYEKVRM